LRSANYSTRGTGKKGEELLFLFYVRKEKSSRSRWKGENDAFFSQGQELIKKGIPLLVGKGKGGKTELSASGRGKKGRRLPLPTFKMERGKSYACNFQEGKNTGEAVYRDDYSIKKGKKGGQELITSISLKNRGSTIEIQGREGTLKKKN